MTTALLILLVWLVVGLEVALLFGRIAGNGDRP